MRIELHNIRVKTTCRRILQFYSHNRILIGQKTRRRILFFQTFSWSNGLVLVERLQQLQQLQVIQLRWYMVSSSIYFIVATAEAVTKASGYSGEIVLDKSLYAAGHDAYLKVMRGLSDEYVRVLIVGHNPGLEELVEMLTGEIHLMPTCSLAHVKLRVDKWSNIDNKFRAQIGEIWLPRDLS